MKEKTPADGINAAHCNDGISARPALVALRKNYTGWPQTPREIGYVAFWHIATFRCDAELGRNRGIADIEQDAPMKTVPS
jgi:hypothetical protein